MGKSLAVKVSLGKAVPKGATPPAGQAGLLFGTADLGAAEWLLVAVDLGAKAPRLWIDSDLDSSLADEEALPIKPPGTAWNHDAKLGKSELHLYRAANCQPDHLHFYPRHHRHGSVVLAGRVRLVVLGGGDALYLDIDGSGTLDTIEERIDAGKPFRVRDEGYVASLPEAGGLAVEFHRLSKAPPPRIRAWKPDTLSAFQFTKPEETLSVLKGLFEKEKKQPPIQRVETVRRVAGLLSDEAFAFLGTIARNVSGEPLLVRREAARGMGHKAYAAHWKKALDVAQKSAADTAGAAALEALHFMGVPERVEVFKRYLHDARTPAMLGAATRGLVLTQDPENLAAVLNAASAFTTPAMRNAAYSAMLLVEKGPPFEAMRAAVRDPAALVRWRSLARMQQLALPETREHALDSLTLTPRYPGLTATVVQILGRDGDGAAVGALFGLLHAK
ncbi:MAG: hypothetical protein ACYSUN_11400, partial [Planctomycetota bacterium]